jgi:alpha-D-ribose 1-methylphosphonate 5-triphosphate synthase subunit PhnH
MISGLTPGFAEPVSGAQSCFRLVLDAMARPGRVYTVRGVEAPAPLCNAAAAVVLTLMDHETPVWLDPEAEAARTWITFHTGATITDDPARAIFILARSLNLLARANTRVRDLPAATEWSCLSIGTDEAPETSATVILQVESLTSGAAFVLEGPGLRDPAPLAVAGLPGHFAELWQRNHALFPRGVDLILCAGDRIAALPRSIAVREG